MEPIKDISNILESDISNIIIRIARDNNVQPFIDNPDFLEPRVIKWHQFGLLTHSKKVREVFLNEMNTLLKNWGVFEILDKVLSEKIDNIEKRKLFEISIPLHDLGKITCHKDASVNRKHELASKNLIYESFLNQLLNSFGLTKKQIDYIARCIETHYILGEQLRDVLKHNNNLRLDYVSEESIRNICKQIREDYKDVELELGIFFLCDSLAKTNIRINANADLDIKEQESEIIQILKQKKLNPELKSAVMQLPVSMKIIEVYLKLIPNLNTNIL